MDVSMEKFMRNIYASIYLLAYLVFILNVCLPLYTYFLVVVVTCKLMSSSFVKTIKLFNKRKRTVGSKMNVKPFSDLSLRGALFLLFFAVFSFVTSNYNDAQCVLLAFVTASIVFPTIVDAVKMLYTKDVSWLWTPGEVPPNTDGHLGAANVISIVRISVAAVLPLLFTWMHNEQGRAMCFITLVAVMFTDCVDGIVARKTKSITKAGKYLDPLGDKVLFIPNSIAFILYIAIRETMNSHLVVALAIMMLVTIGRDVLFFIWFATKSKKYPEGIGAGWTDKIRINVIDGWLIVTANLITLGVLEEASVIACLTLAAIAAILSVASVFIDIRRIKKLQTA